MLNQQTGAVICDEFHQLEIFGYEGSVDMLCMCGICTSVDMSGSVNLQKPERLQGFHSTTLCYGPSDDSISHGTLSEAGSQLTPDGDHFKKPKQNTTVVFELFRIKYKIESTPPPQQLVFLQFHTHLHLCWTFPTLPP